MKENVNRSSSTYIDTPSGILTQKGTLFHTTEESLRKYAGELTKYESVEKLIACADVWLRFPLNFALWSTPFLLWQVQDLYACAIILAFFLILSITGPYYVNHTFSAIAKALNQVALQFLLYFFSLSYFLMSGNYTTALLSLGFFVLLRWGLVNKVFNPIFSRLTKLFYNAPYSDKVLKALIVRKSMKYHTELPEVLEVEKSILRKLSGN